MRMANWSYKSKCRTRSLTLKENTTQCGQSPEALESYLLNFGEEVVEALGDEIDRIEARIQAEVPGAKHVDLEAD